MIRPNNYTSNSDLPTLRYLGSKEGQITLKAGAISSYTDITSPDCQLITSIMSKADGFTGWVPACVAVHKPMGKYKAWQVAFRYYKASRNVYRLFLETNRAPWGVPADIDITVSYRLGFFLSPFDKNTITKL